jgi:peptidoglycan/LPS O-acetylase OafA/YrhL
VLDFLRTIAVSLVLVEHCLEAFEAVEHTPKWWLLERLGWIGVMLFFVHTSMVLMFSLERSGTAGLPLLKQFYLRRAFRIYPLSVLVIFIVITFHIPVASWPWQFTELNWSTVVSNLLLIQNLTYAPSVLSPLWSLPLEIQMYVALPFLYWILERGRRVDVAVLVWILFAGLAFAQPHITDRANIAQYAPCFMGGVLAFCLSKRRAATWPFWTWAFALAVTIYGFLRLTANRADAHVMTVSWGLTCAVGWLIPHFAETRSRLVRRVCAIVAKYSYGIYLTHMIVLWVAFVRLQDASIITRVLVGLSLATCLPFVAYHLVEAPAIRMGVRLANRGIRRGEPPISSGRDGSSIAAIHS